jgi:hypothetical protein
VYAETELHHSLNHAIFGKNREYVPKMPLSLNKTRGFKYTPPSIFLALAGKKEAKTGNAGLSVPAMSVILEW